MIENTHPLCKKDRTVRQPLSSADVFASPRPCTVIIPVYNAFEEALACVHSVLEHTALHHRVLVIDDCSPSGRFEDVVSKSVKDSRLCIFRNAENLGFVKTCNYGMERAASTDVVLLNSDTEVSPGWLERLQAAAYARPDAGTVTPLTNSGTICSVPEFLKENTLPAGYDFHEFARLIETTSLREYPELPTCVGFCVYIKREVINRIGMFDAASFGRGYGEENDFSCRLRNAGYVDILDDATFVLHHGRRSFRAETERLAADHAKILAEKHPDYNARVDRFIIKNPLQGIQRRIRDGMLRRWNERAGYAVLHILHGRPITGQSAELHGGIEYHVADLMRRIPEASHWSLHASCGQYWLIAHTPGGEREYVADISPAVLRDLLSPELFDVVHVHHINGINYRNLASALLRHGRYFISLHDFRFCCPTVNLLTLDDRLCNGHECVSACRENPAKIDWLRSTTRDVFQHAKAVFHFSQSTRQYYSQILGGEYPWQLIEHGIDLPSAMSHAAGDRKDAAKPSANTPIKVVFLGRIGYNKGAELIRKIVKHHRLPSGQAVEWHLIGSIDGHLDRAVRQHGSYERKDLPALMQAVQPHFVAILSLCPETYCYTFDEALACGIPVLCTPVGAPAERLRQHQCGWIAESLTVEGVLHTLQGAVDDWDGYRAVCQRIASLPVNGGRRAAEQYRAWYRKACELPSSSGVKRLAKIEQQFIEANDSSSRSLYRWTGFALNHCLSTLEALRLHRLAIKVARRVLPATLQRKMLEMNHLSMRFRRSKR